MAVELSLPIDPEFKINSKVSIELAKLGDATYLLHEEELNRDEKVSLSDFVRGEVFSADMDQHCSDGCYTTSEVYRSGEGVDFVATRRKDCERKPDVFRIWVTKTPPGPSLVAKLLTKIF